MKIKRLVATYIDQMIISFTCVPLFYLSFTYRSIATMLLLYIGYIVLVLIKDIPILGIGKRIFRLEIYTEGTDDVATIGQRILRNITLPIWPIEILVLLFSKSGKRLSDKLFKTEIREKKK